MTPHGIDLVLGHGAAVRAGLGREPGGDPGDAAGERLLLGLALELALERLDDGLGHGDVALGGELFGELARTPVADLQRHGALRAVSETISVRSACVIHTGRRICPITGSYRT